MFFPHLGIIWVLYETNMTYFYDGNGNMTKQIHEQSKFVSDLISLLFTAKQQHETAKFKFIRTQAMMAIFLINFWN